MVYIVCCRSFLPTNQLSCCTKKLTMYLSYILEYTIRNRSVHSSILNGVLWDMGRVHCGICKAGVIYSRAHEKSFAT